MGFGGVFGGFRPAFDAGGAAVLPWYTVTGKTTYAAYQAKGAASYAASKVNLNAPGTRDLADGTAYPTWDATNGWTFVAASNQFLKQTSFALANTGTLLIRSTHTNTFSMPVACIGASEQPVKRVYDINNAMRFYSGGGYYDKSGVYRSANHVWCISKSTAYVDGVPVGTITDASQTSVRLSIGGWWPGYGPYATLSGTVQIVAAWVESLTDAEVAAVSAAAAAL